MDICPCCGGEGENLDMARCVECDGTGLIGEEQEEECYYCHGSGRDELDEMGYCKPCNGTGIM